MLEGKRNPQETQTRWVRRQRQDGEEIWVPLLPTIHETMNSSTPGMCENGNNLSSQSVNSNLPTTRAQENKSDDLRVVDRIHNVMEGTFKGTVMGAILLECVKSAHREGTKVRWQMMLNLPKNIPKDTEVWCLWRVFWRVSTPTLQRVRTNNPLWNHRQGLKMKAHSALGFI